MLRAHVQHHLWAVEQCFSGCRYFYLMHVSVVSGQWSVVSCSLFVVKFGESVVQCSVVLVSPSGHCPLVTNHWPLATGHWPLATDSRCIRLWLSGNVTTGHAPRFDYQSNLFRFAAGTFARELGNNCQRRAGLVPNVARLHGLSQNKARHLRRLRRVENLCFILRGNLFWRHCQWPVASCQCPVPANVLWPPITGH